MYSLHPKIGQKKVFLICHFPSLLRHYSNDGAAARAGTENKGGTFVVKPERSQRLSVNDIRNTVSSALELGWKGATPTAREDALQEAIIEFEIKRREGVCILNPAGFVYTVATRKLSKERKRLQRNPIQDIVSERDWELLSKASQADKKALDNVAELAAIIYEVISEEDKETRQLFWLRIYGGYSFSEISEVIGIPANTLNRRFTRAREKIKGEVLKRLRQQAAI